MRYNARKNIKVRKSVARFLAAALSIVILFVGSTAVFADDFITVTVDLSQGTTTTLTDSSSNIANGGSANSNTNNNSWNSTGGAGSSGAGYVASQNEIDAGNAAKSIDSILKGVMARAQNNANKKGTAYSTDGKTVFKVGFTYLTEQEIMDILNNRGNLLANLGSDWNQQYHNGIAGMDSLGGYETYVDPLLGEDTVGSGEFGARETIHGSEQLGEVEEDVWDGIMESLRNDGALQGQFGYDSNVLINGAPSIITGDNYLYGSDLLLSDRDVMKQLQDYFLLFSDAANNGGAWFRTGSGWGTDANNLLSLIPINNGRTTQSDLIEGGLHDALTWGGRFDYLQAYVSNRLFDYCKVCYIEEYHATSVTEATYTNVRNYGDTRGWEVREKDTNRVVETIWTSNEEHSLLFNLANYDLDKTYRVIPFQLVDYTKRREIKYDKVTYLFDAATHNLLYFTESVVSNGKGLGVTISEDIVQGKFPTEEAFEVCGADMAAMNEANRDSGTERTE